MLIPCLPILTSLTYYNYFAVSAKYYATTDRCVWLSNSQKYLVGVHNIIWVNFTNHPLQNPTFFKLASINIVLEISKLH